MDERKPWLVHAALLAPDGTPTQHAPRFASRDQAQAALFAMVEQGFVAIPGDEQEIPGFPGHRAHLMVVPLHRVSQLSLIYDGGDDHGA